MACTHEKLETLKEAFSLFDRNGDGVISADELRLVMLNLGEPMTAQEAEDMIGQVDEDGDGSVNFKEFVNMI